MEKGTARIFEMSLPMRCGHALTTSEVIVRLRGRLIERTGHPMTIAIRYLSNIRRPRRCSALPRIEVSTMGIARIGGTSVLPVAEVSKKNAPAEAIFLFVPRPGAERHYVTESVVPPIGN